MNHTAAIHVLKNLLQLQQEDYRALLTQLVGKASCTAMTPLEQAKVRTHMEQLAVRMGVQKPMTKARATAPQVGKAPERPQVRKLRAMWWTLADAGAVDRPASPAACNQAVEAWAKRQAKGQAVGRIDALRFAGDNQLGKLIEEMKSWLDRVQKGL